MAINCGCSPAFVKPFFPKTGEVVRLSIIAPQAQKAMAAFEVNGNVSRILMAKKEGLFEAFFAMPDTVLRWWYELLMPDNRVYSVSTKGCKPTVPMFSEGFSLIPNLQQPSWVSEGTCYQIFPDRFKNGDSTLDVKDNEYCFDGYPVQSMNWDSIPLEYSKGHCLDFFNGDLKGIEQAIPHLKALGVTVVYLNPIGCSKTTHRYDCTDFFHVDEKLGGDEAYKNLVSALHKEGIRVITDISINHTGIDHPWFIKAKKGEMEQEFYYPKGNGEFDCWFNVHTLPQLNYNSQELRDKIWRSEKSVIRKFLREPFNQDGWRFDVATTVGNHEKDAFCKEIWREVRKVVKEENPDSYIVGESWEDASPFLQGDQWDGTMNYIGCSRPLRSWMGEVDRFHFNGSSDNPPSTKPFSAQELASQLESQLNSLPGQMVFQQMNLIDSHDQARLHCNVRVFDFDLYASAVMMMFLLPGMPCVYYGDEIALPGPLGSIEQARYSMQWDRAKWDMSFYQLYTSLGKLRKTYNKAVSKGQWSFNYVDTFSLEFSRKFEREEIILVMNRCPEDRELNLPSCQGLRDWFTGEMNEGLVKLEARKSRIFVL